MKTKKVVLLEEARNMDIRPIFPNMVTMSALAFGVSSMHFAFWGNWSYALVCIFLSGIFDGLDGRVARMLNTSSRFGAELDSLSDFVSFGVAPGFLLYQWTMDTAMRATALAAGNKDPLAVGTPWIFVLFLAMCCALRLARFNTMLDDKPPAYWSHFFMGLPAPGGAYFALMPVIFWKFTGWDCFRIPEVVECFMCLSAVLMASRIPTPSLKKIHFPKDKPVYAQMAAVVMMALIALLFTRFWATLSVVGVLYLICVPVSIVCFLRAKRRYEAQ